MTHRAEICLTSACFGFAVGMLIHVVRAFVAWAGETPPPSGFSLLGLALTCALVTGAAGYGWSQRIPADEPAHLVDGPMRALLIFLAPLVLTGWALRAMLPG